MRRYVTGLSDAYVHAIVGTDENQLSAEWSLESPKPCCTVSIFNDHIFEGGGTLQFRVSCL